MTTSHPIKLNPDDALARRLDQQGATPVIVESNGIRYHVIRAADEGIWAGYDPDRALRALEKSAGILKAAGVDAEQLLKDIDADRTQHGNGRPA